jgi:hypothetical protein
VSSSGLAFEGSGANRTLRITSRANQHGTLQITLTASDGQAVGTRVVQLTLLPVNDVPIRLLLSSTDVYESATGALISPFHVDDPDLDDLHLVTILAPETRFEIVGNELRLKPNVYLPLGTPSPIIFTLRIEDPGNPSFAIEQEVQLTVRPNPFPWRNRRNPLDVDDDGFITPLDAQLAITHLNAVGPLELRIGEWPLPHTGHFLDTSGDNFVTPLDVLLIISNLNSNSGEGEGSDHDISDVADEDIFASSTHTWWLVDSLADDLTRRRNRVLRD